MTGTATPHHGSGRASREAVSHGNGPQMIGYMIEQELGNLLPFEVPFATLLTMVEVDRADPAFSTCWRWSR